MTIEHFKELFEYHYWANDRVWDCISKLSDGQFSRPCDYSVGSLHEQLVHMMSAEDLWYQRIIGASPQQLESTANYPTRDLIAQKWNAIKHAWLTYFDTLSADQLDEVIEFKSITYGTILTCKRWQGISQTLNHATDHRAQILSLIHQVGGETIAQDYIYYVWEE